jgi:endoglucanase
VVAYLSNALRSLADEVQVDRMGNVIAAKAGSGPGPTLMLAAHTDEIACIVKSVEKNGFIRFEKTGLFGDVLLPGRRMRVSGRVGVVGIKPGHLQTDAERREVKPISELYIDIGASTDEEVFKIGIKPGTPVYFIGEFVEMLNPDLVCSKSIDDRAGCNVLLQLMRELKGEPFAGKVYATFTVQEEVGFRGAKVVAQKLNPDMAIAIDTIPCGDTPDVSFTKELPIRLGGGPAIPVGESVGLIDGHLMPMRMRELITGTAEKHGIPYQMTVLLGSYATDATSIHLALSGIATGVVAIPRRYSHSPIEITHVGDSANAVLLLKEFIKEMKGFPERLKFLK